MSTWRNAPRWWRLAFVVVAVTALVWSWTYPAAAFWCAVVMWLAWEVEGAEQAIAHWQAAEVDATDRAEAAEARLREATAARTSELRRRLAERQAVQVTNVYRLPGRDDAS